MINEGARGRESGMGNGEWETAREGTRKGTRHLLELAEETCSCSERRRCRKGLRERREEPSLGERVKSEWRLRKDRFLPVRCRPERRIMSSPSMVSDFNVVSLTSIVQSAVGQCDWGPRANWMSKSKGSSVSQIPITGVCNKYEGYCTVNWLSMERWQRSPQKGRTLKSWIRIKGKGKKFK